MIQTLKWKLWKPILWAYQRVVRGYDDRVTWCLHEYIDPMITAHLEFQLAEGSGYPVELTRKKWNVILKTMLKGFREEPNILGNKKAYKKWQKDRTKALVLFSIYYDWLWD